MADITIPAGDYPVLYFSVVTATGGAYNLTGKTITFYAWPPGQPANLLMSGTATPSTATSGTCSYASISTDFVLKGDYFCELEFTEVGIRESTKSYTLKITESA